MFNSKYNSKKVECEGRIFDSKLEANIYKTLKERLTPYDFEIGFQPKFVLQQKFVFNGHIVREVSYKADFLIFKKQATDEALDVFEYAVIDAKGMETPEFKLKRKLFIKRYNKDIVIFKSIKPLNILPDDFQQLRGLYFAT